MIDCDNFKAYDDYTEDFIREYKDEVNWNCVSCSLQELSEEFMDEFTEELNWEQISYHKNLTEAFIRIHRDDVCWGYIGMTRLLSEEFKEEFKDILLTDAEKQVAYESEFVTEEGLRKEAFEESKKAEA